MFPNEGEVDVIDDDGMGIYDGDGVVIIQKIMGGVFRGKMSGRAFRCVPNKKNEVKVDGKERIGGVSRRSRLMTPY